MLKQDFKRYFFSWGTVLAVVGFLATTAMSFYDTYEFKELMKSYVGMPTHHDPVKLAALIESIDMTDFLQNFWSDDSASILFPTVALIWEGVFLSNIFMTQRLSGQGNTLITRMNFNKYIRNTIVSQTLYIGAVLGIFNVLLNIIAFILGGLSSNTPISKMLIVLVVQPINIYIILVLFNIISLFLLMFFNNKYLAMAAPVIILQIVPFVTACTIGNMSGLAAKIITIFNPLNAIRLSAELISSTNSYFESFCDAGITILLYIAVVVILYIAVIKKYSRDYI